MPDKVLPQATALAERKTAIPDDIVGPLRPHIAGGHAELRRYPQEKTLSLLGDYVPGADTAYNWPGRTPGAVVDRAFVKLTIENAWLTYFTDLIGSGVTVQPVAGRPDRVKALVAGSLRANGTTYPRLAGLYDRDVAVGDGVIVRLGADVLQTTVVDLVPDVASATVGAAAGLAGNSVATPSPPAAAPTVAATGGGATGGSLAAGTYQVRFGWYGPFGETWSSAAASVVVGATNIPRVTFGAIPAGATGARIYVSDVGGTAATCRLYGSAVAGTTFDLTTANPGTGALYLDRAPQTAGVVNGVTATTASLAAYHGEAVGRLYEVYTVAVIQASTGGNLTTALLQVTSASGTDDVASVAPSATGVATAIGGRGLTGTWTRSSGDFAVGQTWQFTVREPWTPVTAAAAGTYTGPADQTYLVTVTRGGAFTDPQKPQVSSISSLGTDATPPADVTASGGAVAVGAYGVTIALTGTALEKGDQYTIAVTAGTPTNYRTIVLGKNLSAGQQAAGDLDLFLAIKVPALTVPQQRADSPPNLAWTTTADQITVKAALKAYDATYTNAGAPVALLVTQGTAYATYRSWLPTLAGRVTSVFTEVDLIHLFGTARRGILQHVGDPVRLDPYKDPDNPLGYAAWKAVQNANGAEVRLTALVDPTDVSEWQSVLDILRGETDYHDLVPLTRDAAVLAAYQAEVQRVADDVAAGEWRTCWLNPAAVTTRAVVTAATTADLLPPLATVADDPAAAGTQYTLLVCTTGNGLFRTNGVQAGDTVRYLYAADPFGGITYQEFPVQSVANEDTLVLAAGPAAAVGTAQPFEIWRSLSKDAIADDLIALLTGTAVHKRVKYLWPDLVEDDLGYSVPGYFLCAAYAGLCGSIAPQQGLRGLSVAGFSGASRSSLFFNNAQLRKLGDAGYFVVASLADGTVYAKRANTTDVTELNTREENLVRLDDAIRQLFYQKVAANFGNATVSDESLVVFHADANGAAQRGIGQTRVDRIGPMMTSAKVDVRRHATQADRVVVVATVTRGNPANNADVLIEV